VTQKSVKGVQLHDASGVDVTTLWVDKK